MSELDARFVKKGFWINHENGYILGQTLTVETRTGTIVVALLTILVSAGTAQLWNIFTFLYHQCCADRRDADGLFWQYQALLRTMPTPTALMADTLKLSWVWRTKARWALLRGSLPFLVALLFAVASIAAGILTAFVMDSSNIEVLVNSPSCGRFNYTKVYATRITSTLLTSIKSEVDTYSFECYKNQQFLPAPCRNIFTRPNISFNVDAAPCPWNTTMCHGGKLPAIRMDSGMVDLRVHFGLNLLPAETVKVQRKTVCNVLPVEDRIIVRDASWWTARGFNETRTTIEYGTYRNTDPILRPEATFIQAEALTQHQQSYGSAAMSNYSQPEAAALGVNAIPEMQRHDADVALAAIWLNRVTYETPVDDPLFSAHKSLNFTPGGGAADILQYRSDNAAGVIGCTQQFRYCVAQAGKNDFCTPLAGSPLDNFIDDFPPLKPVQRSLLQLLRSMSRLACIEDGAQTTSLLAKSYIYNGWSPGLPKDQWVKEVIAWESRVWASYQTLIAAAVIGPSVFDEYAHEYTEPVNNEGDRQMCQSLKMRKSGSFANINVFALAFVITFSALVTFCNTFILRFFIFMAKFRAALAPRIDHWVQDGVYQLQRRAFEAQGHDRWLYLEEEIPITLNIEKLRQLPVESSLVVRYAESRQFVRPGKLKKTGTNITEETLVECDEKKASV